MALFLRAQANDAIHDSLAWLCACEDAALCIRHQSFAASSSGGEAREVPQFMKDMDEHALARLGFRYVATMDLVFQLVANVHRANVTYDSLIVDLHGFADFKAAMLPHLATLALSAKNVRKVVLVTKDNADESKRALVRLATWRRAFMRAEPSAPPL